MKLTFQVPDIIVDNTKSEQLVELITKASQSLDISGSLLLSDGNQHFVVYTLSDLTSSLIHAVNANSPLTIDNSDPLRPVVKIGSPIPAVSGGTGLGTLASGTILVANSSATFTQTSGSTFLNNHLAAGGNIGLSVVGDRVSIALSSSLTGLGSVSASSFTGSGASLTNLTASQIGGLSAYIQNSITGSGSITISSTGTASLNQNVSASNYSASGYFYGDGSKLTNISAAAIAGVVKYLSASSPLSASVNSNGTGSIALMSASLSYNGVAVSLGQSGSIPLVQSLTSSNNNITFGSSSLSGAVTASLSDNLNLISVTASCFTGSFKGDGSQLTNIGATSISGVVKYLSASSPLSASVNSNGTGSISLMSQSVNYNGTTVSLGGSGSIALVQSLTSSNNNITFGSSSLSGAVTASLSDNLNLISVTASCFTGSFKGDGSQLTGLISSIYTSGSITGSGLTANNAIRLKDNVEVVSISASAGITGSFSGSGANLNQLQISDYLQLLPVGNVVIPTNLTASYIYTSGSTNDMYFTQHQGPFTNTTRLRWLESALNTGLLHGGVVTTVNGTNTFSVTSGSGLIVTFNASTGSDPYPTINFLSWPASSSIPLQFSSSAPITYISIKPSDADKSIGEIRQTTAPASFGDFKTYINLGRVLHQSGAVTNGAINTPATAYAVNSNIADFVRAIGPLKINGHYLEASASATNLSLKKSTGDSYVEGRNYAFDPNIPNIVLAANDIPVTVSKIFRQYMSGSTPIINTNGNAGYPTLDAANYQLPNGTTGSVGTDFTVQRIFWFPRAVNNALFAYYGQAKYANIDDAIAGISTENFVEGDNTRSSAILVGYVVLKGNAADFSSTNTSRIYQAGLFRGGAGGGGGGVSGGATSLANLTDVSLGSQQDGQALVWNASKWANGTPHNALTASYLSGFNKNDYLTTASFNTFSGSYMTGSFTGSLIGTASYASDALSASHAITSSYATNSLSASYATTSSYASDALSASFATTASYATNAGASLTASYINSLTQSVYISGSLSASNGISSSFNGDGSNITGVVTASFATSSLTSSYVNALTQSVYISGNLSASSGVSGSFYGDGSQITGITTASFATSSLTSSYVNPLTQSVYISGNISASSGVSGSFYGDGSQITGITTASFATSSLTSSYVNPLTQSVYISGNLSASNGLSGSFYGDGSQITGVITASFATSSLTASYINSLTQSVYVSGNVSASNGITGSFNGDGSSITSLTASQIGGLQQYIYNNITGSGSVTVSNGTASLNASASVSTLTASTHISASKYYGDGSTLSGIQTVISASGNITGSGTSTNTLRLKDSVSLSGDLTASYVTASNITASNIVKASYLYGNGANITSLDLTHVSGALTTDHGGTGLSSFTSGALYIASSTSTLAPFTGSDFQLIAWNSAASSWQSYSQPYDVAGEISGSYSSGSTVLSFKIPRNMTFTGIAASVQNFVYRINGTDFTPSSARTASANDILTVVASSASANQYFTLLGQLR